MLILMGPVLFPHMNEAQIGIVKMLFKLHQQNRSVGKQSDCFLQSEHGQRQT